MKCVICGEKEHLTDYKDKKVCNRAKCIVKAL